MIRCDREVDNSFGVSLGLENMAVPHQVSAKLVVIVNFAVKDDVNAPVFVGQWLMTTAQVNYGEPTKAEADRTRDEIATVVRATMADRVGHALDESWRNPLGPVKE